MRFVHWPVDHPCRARQLNAIVWLAGTPRLHEVNVFSGSSWECSGWYIFGFGHRRVS